MNYISSTSHQLVPKQQHTAKYQGSLLPALVITLSILGCFHLEAGCGMKVKARSRATIPNQSSSTVAPYERMLNIVATSAAKRVAERRPVVDDSIFSKGFNEGLQEGMQEQEGIKAKAKQDIVRLGEEIRELYDSLSEKKVELRQLESAHAQAVSRKERYRSRLRDAQEENSDLAERVEELSEENRELERIAREREEHLLELSTTCGIIRVLKQNCSLFCSSLLDSLENYVL
jgi:hypothetical protein